MRLLLTSPKLRSTSTPRRRDPTRASGGPSFISGPIAQLTGRLEREDEPNRIRPSKDGPAPSSN
jgi:hypothetical protein